MLKKKLGKNVYLKRLEEKDYKHLFYLRKKKSLTKYLNTISDNINDQKKFIIQEIKKKNYLFGIYDIKDHFIGTISIYNISRNKSAEWGRWICDGDPRQSLESVALILEYAFDVLSLKTIFSRTLSKNKKVINIHNKLGLNLKSENYCDFYIKKTYYNSTVHFCKKKDYLLICKKIQKIINF